ncbi:MAG TPA: 30S ribosomal protein S8e [Nitrososphaerales archaeon]
MNKSTINLTKQKATGGKRIQFRSRRKFEESRYASETLKGERELVKRRIRGGKIKLGLRSIDFANVVDPSTKKVVRAKIVKTIKNPANRDYERRGVITKGSSIETDKGAARVTSRPGCDGVVNAVLLK